MHKVDSNNRALWAENLDCWLAGCREIDLGLMSPGM